MSDSWIAWKPRIEEPSNICPSTKKSSSTDSRRHVEVLHDAGQVAEADVDELDVLVLDEAQDFVGVAEHPSSSGPATVPSAQATRRAGAVSRACPACFADVTGSARSAAPADGTLAGWSRGKDVASWLQGPGGRGGAGRRARSTPGSGSACRGRPGRRGRVRRPDRRLPDRLGRLRRDRVRPVRATAGAGPRRSSRSRCWSLHRGWRGGVRRAQVAARAAGGRGSTAGRSGCRGPALRTLLPALLDPGADLGPATAAACTTGGRLVVAVSVRADHDRRGWPRGQRRQPRGPAASACPSASGPWASAGCIRAAERLQPPVDLGDLGLVEVAGQLHQVAVELAQRHLALAVADLHVVDRHVAARYRATFFFSCGQQVARPGVGVPSPTSTTPGRPTHPVHDVLVAGHRDARGDRPAAAQHVQRGRGRAGLALDLGERRLLGAPAEDDRRGEDAEASGRGCPGRSGGRSGSRSPGGHAKVRKPAASVTQPTIGSTLRVIL